TILAGGALGALVADQDARIGAVVDLGAARARDLVDLRTPPYIWQTGSTRGCLEAGRAHLVTVVADGPPFGASELEAPFTEGVLVLVGLAGDMVRNPAGIRARLRAFGDGAHRAAGFAVPHERSAFSAVEGGAAVGR